MIRLEGLTKRFGEREAVCSLSLEIARGEVFGLLGPNGAGKTTTISMMIGTLPPTSGDVHIDGKSLVDDPSLRRRVGVAPQALALYEDLTARENLAFFGGLYGLGGRELNAAVDGALEMVGLRDRAGDRSETFSGGMQRRLNLAAALVHGPDVLLLDEPTAGVDPQSRNSIIELVRSLKARGTTIVYTTHYMEEAQKLCDRVGVMDRGSMLALGTIHELLKDHGGDSVVVYHDEHGEQKIVTRDPAAEVARLIERGVRSGLRIDRPDLESVFLNLTGRALRDGGAE
ncbi:MAG: ABC transporter ATP-binding protein [Phycisphaerales bacterium]|nr:ABC transporter ATP-binding protein [Phycisphaerales bacterium]